MGFGLVGSRQCGAEASGILVLVLAAVQSYGDVVSLSSAKLMPNRQSLGNCLASRTLKKLYIHCVNIQTVLPHCLKSLTCI